MPEHRLYNPTWLSTTPVAHRGLYGAGVPENSLAAFKAAAAAGYAIELDVRLSSDRRLVVIHDRNTRRLTRHDLVVTDTPASQLTKLRLQGTVQTISLLEDVLKTVRGRVPVLIEVKYPTPARVVGPLLAQVLAKYRGEVAVEAFDPRVVAWLRHHAGHIPRGQNAGQLPEYTSVPRVVRRFLCNMPFNFFTRPQFLTFDIRDYPHRSLLFWEHILNVPVIMWTVKTKRHLAVAKHENFNVIFERLRP
jgi:glycerophosphoryl diester phosphodiesterase